MELVRYSPKNLIKFNPNHEPAGSAIGGQFTSGVSGGGSDKGLSDMYRRISEPDGGFTYQPKTHEEPSAGYAVSIYPQHSFAKDGKDLTPNDLAQYYHDHLDLFQKEDHFIGGWHNPDTGQVFLDVSVVVGSHEEAIKLANQHDQIAYFGLKEGKSFTVNKDAKSGGVAKGVLDDRQAAQGPIPWQGHDAPKYLGHVPGAYGPRTYARGSRADQGDHGQGRRQAGQDDGEPLIKYNSNYDEKGQFSSGENGNTVYDHFMNLPEPVGQGSVLRTAYQRGVTHVKYGHPLIEYEKGSQLEQAQRAGVDRTRAKVP